MPFKGPLKGILRGQCLAAPGASSLRNVAKRSHTDHPKQQKVGEPSSPYGQPVTDQPTTGAAGWNSEESAVARGGFSRGGVWIWLTVGRFRGLGGPGGL